MENGKENVYYVKYNKKKVTIVSIQCMFLICYFSFPFLKYSVRYDNVCHRLGMGFGFNVYIIFFIDWHQIFQLTWAPCPLCILGQATGE